MNSLRGSLEGDTMLQSLRVAREHQRVDAQHRAPRFVAEVSEHDFDAGAGLLDAVHALPHEISVVLLSSDGVARALTEHAQRHGMGDLTAMNTSTHHRDRLREIAFADMFVQLGTLASPSERAAAIAATMIGVPVMFHDRVLREEIDAAPCWLVDVEGVSEREGERLIQALRRASEQHHASNWRLEVPRLIADEVAERLGSGSIAALTAGND